MRAHVSTQRLQRPATRVGSFWIALWVGTLSGSAAFGPAVALAVTLAEWEFALAGLQSIRHWLEVLLPAMFALAGLAIGLLGRASATASFAASIPPLLLLLIVGAVSGALVDSRISLVGLIALAAVALCTAPHSIGSLIGWYAWRRRRDATPDPAAVFD